MNFPIYYEASLFKRRQQDDERFAEWTAHLPIREESTPYHCGPHSLRSIEAAYEMAGRPKRVLEIGFCLGHSASMFFGLGAQEVTSVDNSERQQTRQAVVAMRNKFGGGFRFVKGTSADVRMEKPHYGLAFIDGGHEFHDVASDIDSCLALDIPWMLFDDVAFKWGPGVMPAIESRHLIPLAIFGNLCLCVPQTETWTQ